MRKKRRCKPKTIHPEQQNTNNLEWLYKDTANSCCIFCGWLLEDYYNEVSCSTCIYAYCHSQDYPCCECNPHTLDKWMMV